MIQKKLITTIQSYTENPSLGFPVVETHDGKTEYRKNTKFVKGKYYSVFTDIFYIESEQKWYRTTSGKIEKDWETGEWFIKDTKKMINGIVDVDFSGNVITGRFTKNEYNNCPVVWKNSNYTALNPEILKMHFFEDVSANVFYKTGEVGKGDKNQMEKIRPSKSYTNKGYNIEDNAKEFEQKKELYKNYGLKIGDDAKKYAKFLGNTSFGCEFEASVGSMPDYLQNRLGLVICRDGSLEGGPEYVTVPMEGAKGIQNIINTCKELQKRNQIDIRCSYHIHLGNLPKERVYLVALYMLCYQIQDDIFKMFPYYKLDHRGIKRKNYCQKLKKMSIYSLKDQSKEGYDQFVDVVYNRIFEFLSEGHHADQEVNRTQMRHPIREKWQRSCRYYDWNFINMLFSPSGTCESRLHDATLNSQRAVNWLFMNRAVIAFAENNIKKIICGDTISFIDVLNFYKTHYKSSKDAMFLSDYLIAYYTERKNRFAKDIENGDKVSEWCLKDDLTYKFQFDGKALFRD